MSNQVHNGYTGELYEAVEHVRKTRGAICERTENQSGRKGWCARFTCPDGDLSAGRVLWLDGEEEGEWFSPDEGKWFAMAISLRRNVSVKFHSLQAACKFMSLLKGAEVEDGRKSL